MYLHPATTTFLTLLLALSSGWAQQTAYDHGTPSGREQEMIEMINRARANPPAEGERLATTDDPDIVNAYNFFGVDLDILKNEFASYPPRPPLAGNAALIIQSRNHSQVMIDEKRQRHSWTTGGAELFASNGYSIFETGGRIGENVFAWAESTWQGHAGFNVDWGRDTQGQPTPDGMQPARGHRMNIMEPSGEPGFLFREIGMGIVDAGAGSSVGPMAVTQQFGLRVGMNFLLGVVYNDADGDNFYDDGEGIGGVEVRPDSGDWYAVTAPSGAYSIPLEEYQGPMTLTYSGGNLSPISVTIVLTPENRKVDVVNNVVVDGGAYGGPWNFVAGADGGWSKSSWFDWIYVSPDAWTYHPMFGWVYPAGASDDMSLYDPVVGWLWTSADVYPFFYSYDHDAWLYWWQNTPTGGRWFVRYDQNGTTDVHESEL